MNHSFSQMSVPPLGAPPPGYGAPPPGYGYGPAAQKEKHGDDHVIIVLAVQCSAAASC